MWVTKFCWVQIIAASAPHMQLYYLLDVSRLQPTQMKSYGCIMIIIVSYYHHWFNLSLPSMPYAYGHLQSKTWVALCVARMPLTAAIVCYVTEFFWLQVLKTPSNSCAETWWGSCSFHIIENGCQLGSRASTSCLRAHTQCELWHHMFQLVLA